jgi:spermidine synthase
MRERLFESLTATSGAYVDATRCIARKQSAYQLIEIFETPDLGRLMRIDGANMTSDRDEFFYHENLVHPAAVAHPNPRDVLIIGGGDGGSSEEILKHPSVTRCVIAELDGDVIELSRTHMPDVHRNVFADARLQVHVGDGMAFVREVVDRPEDRFDLIYLDLTDPHGAAEALYSQTFFAECKSILCEGGALVCHIGSTFAHRERVIASNANIHAVFQHAVPYFAHIPIYAATWGFMVASDALNIRSISAPEIDARLGTRQIGHRQFYNGATHHAMLAVPEYAKSLLDVA